ncbi:MAG: hypothetical protein QOF13_766 [Solirubrobacterales bacterium]|jgi:hypothetical protein|nr:hypothetical protein [Solirubrobacterales bacterium]
MPARIAIALTVAAVLAAAGCGRTDDATPVACLEGSSAYLRALRAAPGAVMLADETPISDCLAENQKAGDLATVGTAMLATATKFNAEARADPGGNANLELGYLLGAAQRGADNTDGIHAELIRRLSAAARYSPENQPLPPAFLRTYREGFDAGHANG